MQPALKTLNKFGVFAKSQPAELSKLKNVSARFFGSIKSKKKADKVKGAAIVNNINSSLILLSPTNDYAKTGYMS